MFIIDKSKIEESLLKVFDAILEECNLDYESKIESYNDYRYKNDYILPEENNPDDCYVINVSHSNDVLNMLVEKFFKPIKYTYNEED